MGREHEARRADAEEAEPVVAAAGRRSLIASRYPALAQALGDRAGGGGGGEPTIHDAATAAVEHKGGGAGVDPGVAARVGAHLGADFSGVRVHSDPLAQQATAAMGARAFAYGGDVFLGAGESGGDVGLMAHELTHVAQQGAAGQRAVQRRVQVGDADSPAEREADQVAAAVTGGQGRPAALLVDDGPVQSGQMLKSQFLEQLRAAVTAAADAELGPIYSAIGCPYIEQYFGRYAGQPAAAGEALLRRYAPAARTARQAAEMIPAVVARVREGVRQWRDTGQAPADVAAMAPGAAASGEQAASGGGAAGPAQAQALRAADGGETLASLEAELGPGQPLDGATASRMSGALGVDVSAAQIHTGPVAARKAADAGALAFAVGPNVVMGAGAPGAGTLEGDALLAHELAHTAQQAGAASDPAARRKPIGREDAAAEANADEAATAALAEQHGAAQPKARTTLGSLLRTGLQLQRCPSGDKQKAEALAKELQTLIDGAVWKEIRKTAYPKESAAGIKRAKERKDGKRPDLTGLGKITALEHFATAIKAVQAGWAPLSPDDRTKAIAKAINAELVAAGVPEFLEVKPIKTEFKGSFQRSKWRFNISEEMVNKSPLGDADAAELCNTALHEARHAEQQFLAARYAAGPPDNKDAAAIAAEQLIPEDPIAKAAVAQKFDGATDPTVAALGKNMYKATVTDRAANQQISDDDYLPEMAAKRAEAQTALDNLKATPNAGTIAAAVTKRDELKAAIAEVERRYTLYRNIPYEADAHEVGDAAEQAFKGWP